MFSAIFFWRRLAFLGAALIALLPAAQAASQFVTLKDVLREGKSANLNLRATHSGVELAEARQDQARAAAYPKILGTAVAVPIFGVTGNAVASEDHWDRWGVWLQSTLQILQPVFTWGKISGYKDAAAAGLRVAQAQYRADENQLIYELKETYWGAVLAEQLYNFLQQGKEDIQKVIEEVERDQKKNKPSVERRDYFRLKIFSAEATYRLEEATKLRSLARMALSLRMGRESSVETLPAETVLTPLEDSLPKTDVVIASLKKNRPEFEQLEYGIQAKTALLQAEKANKYPMVFVGGQLQLAYSNVRDTQASAFAFDPYNRSTGGVGLGVQWNFDFFTTAANEKALRVEVSELERKRAYAHSGLELEARKALADLVEASQRLKASKEAFEIGKRWLGSESLSIADMPEKKKSGQIKNLIDAYLGRAKTAKDHWESVYLLNTRWAMLSKTVGEELNPQFKTE